MSIQTPIILNNSYSSFFISIVLSEYIFHQLWKDVPGLSNCIFLISGISEVPNFYLLLQPIDFFSLFDFLLIGPNISLDLFRFKSLWETIWFSPLPFSQLLWFLKSLLDFFCNFIILHSLYLECFFLNFRFVQSCSCRLWGATFKFLVMNVRLLFRFLLSTFFGLPNLSLSYAMFSNLFLPLYKAQLNLDYLTTHPFLSSSEPLWFQVLPQCLLSHQVSHFGLNIFVSDSEYFIK